MVKIIRDSIIYKGKEYRINKQTYEAICAKWYAGEGEEKFASVTQLQQPLKVFVLWQRHDTDIILKASDLIFILFGSAMHEVLRKGANNLDSILSEKRLEWDFEGYRITGGYDAFEVGLEDNILTDHKATTVSTWIYGDRVKDFTHQLNCYKLLAELNGYPPITKLLVDYFFRDWSKMENIRRQEKNKKYPPIGSFEEEMKVMTNSETNQYIRDQIQEMVGALSMEDDEIPPCEKRWKNDIRCKHYCEVNKWCNYYKEKYL
jgi:hypothetical protein